MNTSAQSLTAIDRQLLDAAVAAAEQSASQGGIPIGSALGSPQGEILATGHNLRVQTGDPTAHAEIVCIRNAGRRRDWRQLTLATTLSPCVMCTGATLLHRIGRVVVGERKTFAGEQELLQSRGVEVINVDDGRCKALMDQFIAANPDIWSEDIGDPD